MLLRLRWAGAPGAPGAREGLLPLIVEGMADCGYSIGETAHSIAEPGEEKGVWYLGFDVATKSFAFSLMRIRRISAAELRAGLLGTAEAIADGELRAAAAQVACFAAATRGAVRLVDGEACDLAPGRPDKSIHTIERAQLATKYVERRIFPALEAARALGCPPRGAGTLRVAIEYQMGPNSPNQTVQAALASIFAYDDTFMIGPSLKNKMRFPSQPDLDYSHFISMYETTYSANKAHTLAVYKYLEAIFDFAPIMARTPKKLQKDLADSAVQIVAFVRYGDIGLARSKY